MSAPRLTLLWATNRGLYPRLDTPLGIYGLLAQSLLAQTIARDEYEVVVVDRYNPTPRRELHFLEDRVRYVRPRATPWSELGLFAAASARNTGLMYVQGQQGQTVVAVDDCYELSPRFLERIAHHAERGQYVVPHLASTDTKADAQRFRAPLANTAHPGGICSYPLAKVIALNGYDERYDGGAAYEDLDLSARLELAGVQWCRDDDVVATGHPHRGRFAQPKCAKLVWLMAEDRRRRGGANALRANEPWTVDELCEFDNCGRAKHPPRCWRTVCTDPHVGVYGGECDYDPEITFDPEQESDEARVVRVGYLCEPESARTIRTTYEARPWFDLAAERARVRGAEVAA